MFLRAVHEPILDLCRQALQREVAAHGVAQARLLPDDVIQACLTHGITTWNQQTLFGTAPEPFEDTPASRQLLLAYLLGYGPADIYLGHDNLEDFWLRGPGDLFALYGESDDPAAPPPGKRLVPGFFRDDAHVIATFKPKVEEVGKAWDIAHPVVNAVLPGRLRLHAQMPPAARCVLVSIRRHRGTVLLLSDLVAHGSLSPAMATFLASAVIARLNILIVGGTGSGKTTLLDALLLALAGLGARAVEEHVVVIETDPELAAPEPAYAGILPHVSSLLTGTGTADGPHVITQRDQVRAAMRLRPTRVVIGEMLGGEAYDWLQALNAGHNGSLSTIHANSCRDGLRKLAAYTLQAETDLPMEHIVESIANLIDLVVYLEADRHTGQRRVVEIAGLAPYTGGTLPNLDSLWRWEAETGAHRWTGILPRCAAHLRALSLPLGADVEAMPAH